MLLYFFSCNVFGRNNYKECCVFNRVSLLDYQETLGESLKNVFQKNSPRFNPKQKDSLLLSQYWFLWQVRRALSPFKGMWCSEVLLSLHIHPIKDIHVQSRSIYVGDGCVWHHYLYLMRYILSEWLHHFASTVS